LAPIVRWALQIKKGRLFIGNPFTIPLRTICVQPASITGIGAVVVTFALGVIAFVQVGSAGPNTPACVDTTFYFLHLVFGERFSLEFDFFHFSVF
jgi:hypothetical protein